MNLVFQIFGRSHRWCLHLRTLGERSMVKNYSPVSLLFVTSKIFEILVNNRLSDHFEKCGPFPDFQYGSKPCQLTADLLVVVSNRIARVFISS